MPNTPATRHPSVETLRSRLSIRSAGGNMTIFLDEERVGSLVSYGKPVPGQKRSAFVPTVYGIRIGQPGLSMQEEAATRPSALNKVAAAMSAALRSGAWSLPVTVAAPQEAAEPMPPGPRGF